MSQNSKHQLEMRTMLLRMLTLINHLLRANCLSPEKYSFRAVLVQPNLQNIHGINGVMFIHLEVYDKIIFIQIKPFL